MDTHGGLRKPPPHAPATKRCPACAAVLIGETKLLGAVRRHRGAQHAAPVSPTTPRGGVHRRALTQEETELEVQPAPPPPRGRSGSRGPTKLHEDPRRLLCDVETWVRQVLRAADRGTIWVEGAIAQSNSVDVSAERNRYTGKERDDESPLCHFMPRMTAVPLFGEDIDVQSAAYGLLVRLLYPAGNMPRFSPMGLMLLALAGCGDETSTPSSTCESFVGEATAGEVMVTIRNDRGSAVFYAEPGPATETPAAHSAFRIVGDGVDMSRFELDLAERCGCGDAELCRLGATASGPDRYLRRLAPGESLSFVWRGQAGLVPREVGVDCDGEPLDLGPATIGGVEGCVEPTAAAAGTYRAEALVFLDATCRAADGSDVSCSSLAEATEADVVEPGTPTVFEAEIAFPGASDVTVQIP